MKTLITTTLLVLLYTVSSYGQRTVHKYIDEIKKDSDAIAMTIPGWLARTGVRMAIEEEVRDSRGYRDIVRGIKQIRLVVLSEGHMPTTQQIEKMTADIKEQDGLEEYVKVRDGDSKVWVLIREEKERVKNLLVLTLEDDELAVVNAKLNIPLQALENADFDFNKARKN